MAWMLAIPAAMAAMGYLDKQAQREQATRDRKAEAEIAKWSPWTGMAPQRVGSPGAAIGGAVTGGLQGASFLQSMNAAGYGKDGASGASTTSTGTNNAMPLTQQTAMQQPNMSSEDPYILSQRRYAGQMSYPQQQYPWNEMLASK